MLYLGHTLGCHRLVQSVAELSPFVWVLVALVHCLQPTWRCAASSRALSEPVQTKVFAANLHLAVKLWAATTETGLKIKIWGLCLAITAFSFCQGVALHAWHYFRLDLAFSVNRFLTTVQLDQQSWCSSTEYRSLENPYAKTIFLASNF